VAKIVDKRPSRIEGKAIVRMNDHTHHHTGQDDMCQAVPNQGAVGTPYQRIKRETVWLDLPEAVATA
jgi:hypothetical protein